MDSSFHHVFTLTIALLSAWWLYRNFDRSRDRYELEAEAITLRRQLKKLPVDLSDYLGDRTLEDLNPDELDVLAAVVPQLSRDRARELYKGLAEESLEKDRGDSERTWSWLRKMQAQLSVSDRDGATILTEIAQSHPQLASGPLGSDRTILGRYHSGIAAADREGKSASDAPTVLATPDPSDKTQPDSIADPGNERTRLQKPAE